jgi:hypothetical protein
MAETSWSAVLTGSDSDACDIASFAEEVSDGVLGCVETDISAENAVAVGVVTGALNLATFGLFAGKLNRNFSSHVSASIFGLDCFASTGCVFVFNEGNTSGSAVLLNQLALSHGAVFAEDGTKGILVNVVAERLDENFFVVFISAIRDCGAVSSGGSSGLVVGF